MEARMTKHKVLIPLDGSEFSHQILGVVREYLKPAENELVLLHVAIPVVMPPTTATPRFSPVSVPSQPFVWTTQEQEEYRQQSLAELERKADELRGLGYQVTAEVLFGEPAPQIGQFVKAANCDMVALTTHGRTGLGRLMLGSVADSLLRTLSVPMLLWRPVQLSS
jgi:nucleotide-binding universal stress UspA family protein